MIRVALVSGSRLMTEALGAALARTPEVDLGGMVEGEEGGRALAERCRADAVLIDVELGDAAVVRLIGAFNAGGRRCRCLPVGTRAVDRIVRFIEAGARGYVGPDGGFGQMLRVIRAACRNEVICGPAVAAAVYSRIHALASAAAEDPLAPADLTEREREVLGLLACGLSNKEIAVRLGLAVSTVKNHVHALLRKLEVGKRREAAVLACRAGLIPYDSSFPGRA